MYSSIYTGHYPCIHHCAAAWPGLILCMWIWIGGAGRATSRKKEIRWVLFVCLFVFVILVIEHSTLCMLGKHSTTELSPSPKRFFFLKKMNGVKGKNKVRQNGSWLSESEKWVVCTICWIGKTFTILF